MSELTTTSSQLPARQDQLLKYLLYIICVSFILYFGRTLFIPLALAALISFVLYPVCLWMERHRVHRTTAIILCVAMITLLLAAVSALMVTQLLNFVNEWPALHAKISASIKNLSQWMIEFFGISYEQQVSWASKATDQALSGGLSLLQDMMTASASSLVMLLLVPIYTVLILYNRHTLVETLGKIFSHEKKERIQEILLMTINIYYNFIKGMGLVYVAVGILNSLGLLLLGVPHAILFGFIASILTFIPYIGILIGSLLPITMAWVTYDSVWYPVGVVAVFTFVQYLEANVIFPFAVSSKLMVNTLVVLVAIFLGGILWGVIGMILFVPFIGILKLIADQSPKLSILSSILK